PGRSRDALASGRRSTYVPDPRRRKGQHPDDLDFPDQDLVHGRPRRDRARRAGAARSLRARARPGRGELMSEASAATADTNQAVPRRGRIRSISYYVVLVVAGILLLLSTFAIWVNRVALNTTVFVDTSTSLTQNAQIRQAIATRAVDDLYASVDVQAEI